MPVPHVASTCAVNIAIRSRGFVIVFPLRGRCRLRQMRCNYIRAVGATLLTYVSVSSVTTGRDTAKNVFVECKIASKKAPLKKCVCLTANDLITPHPSPKVTPSPRATQGKAKRVRRKIQQRTNVARGNHGLVGNFDTGRQKLRTALALRETARFSPYPRTGLLQSPYP